MNLNAILSRPQTRTRRTSLGLVLAAVVLGTSLTACGSDADNTTCGELKDKSTSEVVDLFEQAVEEDGDDEAKDLLETLKDLPAEGQDAFAEQLKAACDGESDDTKLKDIDA